MQDLDDLTLLRKYAANNSEAAFAELVSRRIGFVYSAALRQVRDPLMAEEITQAVFIILAQKAGRIPKQTILAGWFFRTTRFAALARVRAAAKQAVRAAIIEKELQMQSELQSPTSDEIWNQMSPLLDEALATLSEKDRRAVLLRFFENKSLADVGGALGIGEDTARKRVSRALEKLHRYFSRRGVTSTTATIAEKISAHSIQAVPAALAKSVTAVAISKGAAASASTLTIVKGALKIMTWTKAKTAIAVGLVVLLASSGGIFIAKEMTAGKSAFEAEGFLEFFSGGRKWTNQFKVFIKGDKWLIRTTPQNSPVNYYEDSYDGKYVYNYQKIGSQPDDVGAITASGVVEANDIPNNRADYAVPTWLAFGSARYFASLEGNAPKPFFDWAEPIASELTKPMVVELKRSDRRPFVPTYVYSREMNRRYRVLQFTNFHGLLVPGEFVLESWRPGTDVSNSPSYFVHGNLAKISKLQSDEEFRPALHGRTYIVDMRFPGGGSADYISTSKDWFATNSPQWRALSKMYDAKAGGIVWPRNAPKIEGVQP